VKKLVSQNLFFSSLFILQGVITIYLNREAYLVILYGMLYVFVMMSLAIVFKYAKYDPLFKRNHSFNFVVILMVLGVMPGLVLAAVISLVYYYFEARTKLKKLTC